MLAILVLVFSAVPASAAAAVEVATQDELQAAISNGADSIKLTANIDADETIRFDYPVVLDGNGYALNRTDGFTDVILLFTGSTATVENLTVDGKGFDCINEQHIPDTYLPYEFWSAAVVSCADTALTMNNCQIKDNIAAGVYSSYILELNGCTISNNDCGVYVYPEMSSDVGVQLTMTDCTVTDSAWDGVYYDSIDADRSLGDVSIAGCTMTGNPWSGIDLCNAKNVFHY